MVKWRGGIKRFTGAITKAFSSTAIHPSIYRGSGLWFFSEDGSGDAHFSYSGVDSSLKAYAHCPPVTAIINRKAQAFVNGKTWIINAEGKQKGKEATTADAVKLRKLMARPNLLQSGRQFEAQNYIYQQACGYSVVLAIKPDGFPITAAKSLWVIPNWMLEIKEKDNPHFFSAQSIKDFIESVTVVWGEKRVPLPLDDLFIFRDNTLSLCSLVLPESRLKSHGQVVNNIIGAMESRGVLIDKRGPSYIISSNNSDASGNVPLTPKEKADVEEDFKKYGLLRKQVQAIVTSANINLQTVGFNTRELMLFEEIEDDVMRLCDVYNYPHRLLSSQKSNSLGGSDVESYKRLLYQDAIIPEAESVYEQWGQFLELEKLGLIIEKDYSHVAALQADKAKEAQARYTLNQALKLEFEAGLITLDEWREKLGDDPLPNGLGGARATDPKQSNAPLATIIGVGGVQSLIQVLTARGMSEEARRNTVSIVFGIAESDAARMVAGSDEQNNQQNNQQNEQA